VGIFAEYFSVFRAPSHCLVTGYIGEQVVIDVINDFSRCNVATV